MAGRRKSQRGVAMVEMVILLPLYFLISLLVIVMGDLMFTREVVEVAARYAAWKQDTQSTGTINTMTLAQHHQSNVTDVQAPRGLVNAAYPVYGTYFSDLIESEELNARKLTPGNNQRLDSVQPNSAQTWAKKIADVDFESEAGGNAYAQFIGGWTQQWKAEVTATYNFHALNMQEAKVGATSFVLSGKKPSTCMTGMADSYDFRDSKPTGNLAGTKWDVNDFGTNVYNLEKEFSSVDAGLFNSGTPYPPRP